MRWLIFCLASLPFLVPFRWYPDGDFFADVIALSFALLIVCMARSIRFSPMVFTGLAIALVIFVAGRLGGAAYLEVWLAPALMVLVGGLLLAGLQARSTEQAALDKTALLYGLVSGGLVTLILAWGQILQLHWLEVLVFQGASGVSANIGQRNQFSLYLLLAFLAFLLLLARQPISLRRGMIPVLLGGFLLAVVIVQAGSRAAVLMVLVAAVFALLRLYWWRDDRLSHFVLAFAVLFLGLQLLSALVPDFFWIGAQGSGLTRMQDAYADARWGEWLKAWGIFLQHPFGVGFGNYAYYSFINGQNQAVVWANPHNMLLHFLVETGVFGGSLIVCALLLVARDCLLFMRSSQGGIFVPCAIVFFVLHNLLEYSLWYANFFFLFIALLAFLPSVGPIVRVGWFKLVPAMIFVLVLVTLTQYGQLLWGVWIVGGKNPVERIVVSVRAGMNPFLSWRADKVLMDYLPYDNGPDWQQRFCRLEMMAQREPLPHYLEKMAFLAIVKNEYDLAGSILKTRYSVLSKMTDEHLRVIATKTWPLAYADLLNTIEAKRSAGFKGYPEYQLGQSGMCDDRIMD